MEQLDQEPDIKKLPPELNDFPEDVQQAIIIHSKLGDRIVSNIGYLGKDYTSLPIHMKYAQISNEELFMETILILDEKIIKKSAAAVKSELDKMKRK